MNWCALIELNDRYLSCSNPRIAHSGSVRSEKLRLFENDNGLGDDINFNHSTLPTPIEEVELESSSC